MAALEEYKKPVGNRLYLKLLKSASDKKTDAASVNTISIKLTRESKKNYF